MCTIICLYIKPAISVYFLQAKSCPSYINTQLPIMPTDGLVLARHFKLVPQNATGHVW